MDLNSNSSASERRFSLDILEENKSKSLLKGTSTASKDDEKTIKSPQLQNLWQQSKQRNIVGEKKIALPPLNKAALIQHQ
jgi:hypothetical protein